MATLDMMIRHIITHPITKSDIALLEEKITPFLQDQRITQVDMGLILTVPHLRVHEVLRALPKPGAKRYGASEGGSYDDEADTLERGQEDDSDNKQQRRILPGMGIMVRLLLAYPELVPLIPTPGAVQTFLEIADFIELPDDMPLADSPMDDARRKRFAPLFGRSAVSSYKQLLKDEPLRSPGGSVGRLHTLVMGKFGEVLRRNLIEEVNQHAARSRAPFIISKLKPDWTILLNENELVNECVPAKRHAEFRQRVFEQKAAWFDLYMRIIEEEAKSRGIEPAKAITKGEWKSSRSFTDAQIRAMPVNERPITPKSALFTSFQNKFELSIAEMLWVLGVQARNYYKMNRPEKAKDTIDPATSILIRYLSRYPEDIKLLFHLPVNGERLLSIIHQQDPDFPKFHLGPLLGGTYGGSYYILKNQQCPYAVRRLSSIIATWLPSHPELLEVLRRCAEIEAECRGVSKEMLWKEGTYRA